MKPSELKIALHGLLNAKLTAFIWGSPGIGKSDIVAQVAAERSTKGKPYELRDVRLGLMDPTDIKGFPNPDAKNNVMRWLPPDFLPTKGQGLLFLDAGRLQQKDERRGGTVHDRHLGGVQIDEQVVDAQTGQGGHEVLHRGNARAAMLQSGTHARVADQMRVGLEIDRLGQVGTPENQTGIRRRGAQGDVHLLPGMQPDASGAYLSL